MDLTILSHIWNHIVESNTLNFIIFVGLFALIFKKININGIIASVHSKIIKVLDEADKERVEALEKLTNAEKAVENLAEDLKLIVKDAEKSAEIISNKIMDEAKSQVGTIEANATKIIEAEEKQLIAKLTKSTSFASVETAQKHIQNVLAQTPTLHEKYINESIEELDRLNF